MSSLQLLKDSFHLDNRPNGSGVYIYEHNELVDAIINACKEENILYINRDHRISIPEKQFDEKVLQRLPATKEAETTDLSKNHEFAPSQELEDFFADLDAEDEAEAVQATSVAPTPEAPASIIKEEPKRSLLQQNTHTTSETVEAEDDLEDDLNDAIVAAAAKVPASGTNLLLKEQALQEREEAVAKLERALAPREEEVLKKAKATQQLNQENFKKLVTEKETLEATLKDLAKQREAIQGFKEKAQQILENLAA